MIIVGLTGGIATGKSTASTFIKNFFGNNVAIIDADKYSYEAVKDFSVFTRIKLAFPQCFHQDNHGNDILDRRQLGSLIFDNPILKSKLESIIHPFVIKKMILSILFAWISFKSIVILDIPLLFECNLDRWCSKVIVIGISNSSIQIKRLKERNGWNEEEAQKRIKSQMPIEEKIKKATILILNDGTRKDLHDQIISKFPKESKLHFLLTCPPFILFSFFFFCIFLFYFIFIYS